MTSFVPVLELRLTHDYYNDGRCTDFDIVPTSDTSRLLANHRLTWKSTPGLWQVISGVDEERRPLLDLAAGTTLRFELKLRNRMWSVVTDYIVPSSGRSLAYLSTADGSFELVERATALPPAQFAELEIDREHIGPPGAPLPEAPPRFELAYEAKRAHWVYYIITDAETATDQLTIEPEQQASGSGPVFGTAGRVRLGAEDPNDSMVARLGSRYPQFGRFRFVSDDPIAGTESGYGRIALRRSGDTLVASLPNPSPADASWLGTVPNREISLYRVVTAMARH